MKRTQLGETALSVTPIGLGLAALGRPGYINLGHAADLAGDYDVAAMQAHAHAVLDAAWAAGVRYFDAARSYGRAETFLAAWLRSRAVSPDEVTVGSKWGYRYTAEWQVQADKHEVKSHTLPVLRQQMAESRAHLGAYLKLYQVHSATLDSGVLDNRDVLDELARLRDEGLVIGLSLSGPGQAETLRRAMSIDSGGAPLFGAVQATWNLLEREAGPALAEANARGMGVIIKEALANGRLTARNDAPSFRPQRERLTRVAAELGTTIDALAMGAALAQPWVGVVLSGAARVEHLLSNLGALEQERWPTGWMSAVDDLVEEPDDYWQTRAGLAWN